MMRSTWVSVMVAVLLVGPVLPGCQGFLDFLFASEDNPSLCEKTCQCPTDILGANKDGIDCHGANITSLSGDVKVPKQYTRVDFSRNHIKSLSNTTFNGASSLVSLDFSDNELEDLPAAVFQPLERLEILLLKNNWINTVNKEAFVGLHNLTRLDLSYNNLSTLPEEVLDELVNLEELYLGFNPLRLASSNTLLTSTVALRVLDLSNLGLHTIHPQFFPANLTKLEKLSLAYNEITVVPSKALHHLRSSLTHLDLSGNPIKSLGAYSFYGLANVRTLIMEQMLKLETIDAYAFGDLRHLDTVVLRYMPRIRTLDPLAFHGTVNGSDVVLTVQDFTFSFSMLTTLPENLLQWSQLHFVSLHFNHWYCDCNMKWMKNSTILDKANHRVLCSLPNRLRGHRIQNVPEEEFRCGTEPKSQKLSVGLVITLLLMGLGASLGTVALLVYWKQGWLWRRPHGAYSNIERTVTAITVADDDMDFDNKELPLPTANTVGSS